MTPRGDLARLAILPFGVLAIALSCPSDGPEDAAPAAPPTAPEPLTEPEPPSLPWGTRHGRLEATEPSHPYVFRPLPIGGGGFVTGLALHPTEPDVVYARTDVGGAFRWSEGQGRWTQLVTAAAMPAALLQTPDLDLGAGIHRAHAYSVESLAISPQDPRALYLAVGDDLQRPGWLLYSADRGESFRALPLSVPMGGNQALRTAGERLAVDPLDARVLYFGSRTVGLQRSDDAGTTWRRLSALPAGEASGGVPVGVAVVKLDPAGNGGAPGPTRRLYASVAGAGLFRSDDAGESWERLHTSFAQDLELGGGLLYAALQEGRVLRCPPPGPCVDVTPPDAPAVEELAVDPRDGRHLLAACEGLRGLYRSRDEGRSWTRLRSGSRPGEQERFRSTRIPWVERSSVRRWLSVGELAFDPHHPGRLWLAEGMGVWRSDEGHKPAPTFDNVSEGIEETVATGLAAQNGAVVATVWDRVGFVFRGVAGYPRAQLGLTGAFANGTGVDATPAGVFAVATGDVRFCCGDGSYAGYSLDSGTSWQPFGSVRRGQNEPRELRFGELAISPEDPANLVWAPQLNAPRLHFTKDFGRTWAVARAQGFRSAAAPHLTTQKRLAADPLLRGVFYAYSWDPGRVFVSVDGGARWAPATGRLPYGAWHGQLRAAPGRRGHLWFCTGPDHRREAGERGLFVSDDGAARFARVDAVDECWGLGFGRALPGARYPTVFLHGRLGGRWGLFRSTDEGLGWTRLAEYPLGLFAEVSALAGDGAVAGRVYLGYRGAGFVVGEPAP